MIVEWRVADATFDKLHSLFRASMLKSVFNFTDVSGIEVQVTAKKERWWSTPSAFHLTYSMGNAAYQAFYPASGTQLTHVS